MDDFKKVFFPHLYVVAEGKDDQDENDAKQVRKMVQSKNGPKQHKKIDDKILELDKMLKQKFANNFTSVKKAFLALDITRDGFIQEEEILRFMGALEMDYTDLKKLIMDNDSSKMGRLSYSDFCKWLGGAIQMSEGFIFRHDSIKNPVKDRYDERLLKMNKDADYKVAAKATQLGNR